jgi:two-component system, OmpR family, sensor histidine kinase ChvG
MIGSTRLIPFTERDIDSPVSENYEEPLKWTGRLSLTWRVLAINVFAILLLAGSLFYIDSFRARLIDERMAQAHTEIDISAAAIEQTPSAQRSAILDGIAQRADARFRLVTPDGVVTYDSWQHAKSGFELNDPRTETWQRKVARLIDDLIDMIVGAQVFERYTGQELPRKALERLSLAADRTHVITVSRDISRADPTMIIMDRNARDIRRLVRAERSRLGLILAATIFLSVLLSLFLARTIALPLRRLARAAALVRLGRAREVVVPRLPSRKDEIGQLARALSDMNQALQARIDATEAFAADVAHEIKNPLASLASAAQSLRLVKDKKQQEQLIDIVSDDVRRLDRLISDISDLSRIDAQIARTTFETVDVGALIEHLIETRVTRDPALKSRFAFARPKTGSALMRAEPTRLGRVFDNLIDNALSFSPPQSVVRITAAKAHKRIIVSVEDQGPGIPDSAQSRIFERFHSDRPFEETFGKHSGLGLSIAKAIVVAHDGTIHAEKRARDQKGARFVISLPAISA